MEATHQVRFENAEDQNVFSLINLEVRNNLAVTYAIKTHSDTIDLNETAKNSFSTYSITYILNGATNPTENPTSYTQYDEFVLKDAIPAQANEKFTGWINQAGNTVTRIDKGTTGDLVLTAAIETFETYTITYVLNGGTNAAGNPTTYTQYDEISLLPATAADSDYSFDYWSDGNGNRISRIEKGTKGNLVLTAHYAEKSYSIYYSYESKWGSNPNPTSYTASTGEIILQSLNMASGYTFVGWYSDMYYENQVTSIPATSRKNLMFYGKAIETPSQSEYEYAYERTGVNYNQYFLFDTDGARFVYFLYGKKSSGSYYTDRYTGTTAGTLNGGLTLYYSEQGSSWTETFKWSVPNLEIKGILTDSSGAKYDFYKTSVSDVEHKYHNQSGAL